MEADFRQSPPRLIYLLQTEPKRTDKHGNEIMCSFHVIFYLQMRHLTKKYIFASTSYSCILYRSSENYLVLRYRICWTLSLRKSVKFDSPYFDQMDSVGMVSPLRPVFVNTWRKVNRSMTDFVFGFHMNILILMTHLPCLTLLMGFLRYLNSRHNSKF